MASTINTPAPNAPYFTPYQNPPAGTAIESDRETPSLFKPLKIRDVIFQNRIFVSPMCNYSGVQGHITPFHLAHYGGMLMRGPGLTMVEATAVSPEGRTTPEDLGIWSDAHGASIKPLVDFAHSQNAKIGIQLAHGGRKSSTIAPWLEGAPVAGEDVGGWPKEVVAPSGIAYDVGYPTPLALTAQGVRDIVEAFKTAAQRAVKAGFDVVEIHAAHGYLLCEFMSPITNQRTDEYGGSWENRVRLIVDIVDAVRNVIPSGMPLFLRLSGTEGLEDLDTPSWTSKDTVRLAPILAAHGVDLLDVSSGGNNPKQKITPGVGYQVPLAAAVKAANVEGLLVGTVGSIVTGSVAQSILDDGKADVVLAGKAFLKNPGLVWAWADELNVKIVVASQVHWGFYGRKRGVKTVQA